MKKITQELKKKNRTFLQFLKSRRFWIAVLGLVFCVFVILNSGFFSGTRDGNFTTQRAHVLSTDNSNLMPDPEYQNMILGTQILEIEFLTGEFKGQTFKNIENRLQPLFSNMAEKDMVMLFNIRSQDGEVIKIDIFGHSRDGLVYALIGLFIALLIIVGKKKGLYSAIGLGFTIITVIFFLLPAILSGHSPVFMAIITSIITSMFTIFLISDISMKGLASMLGILAGVASAGIVGIIAGSLGHVSGLNLSDAEGVLALAHKLPLKIPELLSAGIIIAALGAVVDVSMSITSAIFEVKQLNPDIDVRKLYKSGMNIGGDIMAATTNTLIMAFVGSSFCVLIILALYQLPFICLINLNLFIVELIQGIASSIGLILTVPVTAICAASLAGNKLDMRFKQRRNKNGK